MTHPLQEVLARDPRYSMHAYEFVRDALTYAQDVMGLGTPADDCEAEEEQRHLTGQELCEAGRRLALLRFGMMAKVVLNTWGIHTTGDIGEIVYNMINVDLMRKSPADRREDFDNVYEFQQVFLRDFDFAKSVRRRRSHNR
jgi:uncharacterized repeat protein (TIGR04138 family)